MAQHNPVCPYLMKHTEPCTCRCRNVRARNTDDEAACILALNHAAPHADGDGLWWNDQHDLVPPPCCLLHDPTCGIEDHADRCCDECSTAAS